MFSYEYKGRIMRWSPDFRLPGTFIEIKGYVTEQVEAKFKFFVPPLRVLTGDDLGPMFKHVWQTYGRNVVELYE